MKIQIDSILFAFFCLLVSSSVQANSTIDSLEKVLTQHPSLDNQRVNILNQLGYEYWIVAPEKSEKYGQQALELSELLDYPQGLAYAHRIIGVANWARGTYPLAIEHLLESIEAYHDLDDKLGVANGTLNLGMVYAAQKNLKLSIQYFEFAIESFEKLGETSRIATANTKIGSAYSELGEWDKAYDYFLKALKTHEQHQFVYGIAEVNKFLGILFLEKGDRDKALSYLFRSLETSEQRNDQHGIAATYAKIGHIYLLKKDYPQAETYLNRAKIIAEKLGIKTSQKEIYLDLKILATQQGKYQAALEWSEAYSAAKDSILNEEKAIQIARIHEANAEETAAQKLKIKEQEIAILEQKNKVKLLFLITGLLFIALLIAVIRRIFQKQKQKNRLALAKEQDLRAKQEIQLADEKEKTKELEGELEQKNKELTAYTVNFIRKNEMIANIRKTIAEIRQSASAKTERSLTALEHQLRESFRIDEDWEDFRRQFENVHHNFFSLMKSHHPDLSNNDLKLCVLARLNLNSKEMAAMLGISVDSVKTARYRLRRKLGLERSQGILDYLLSLEVQKD